MGSRSTPLRCSLRSSDSTIKDDKVAGTVELKRSVGLVGAVAIIGSGMIGSGIFISPKGVLQGANSVGMSLIVWLICAVVSFLGKSIYEDFRTISEKNILPHWTH